MENSIQVFFGKQDETESTSEKLPVPTQIILVLVISFHLQDGLAVVLTMMFTSQWQVKCKKMTKNKEEVLFERLILQLLGYQQKTKKTKILIGLRSNMFLMTAIHSGRI